MCVYTAQLRSLFLSLSLSLVLAQRCWLISSLARCCRQFIFHTIPLMDHTAIEKFSWWTISDVFEEDWLGGTPFSGDFGLLT
eukprot:COSAG01_NODE_8383_length_2806_cov_2.432582_2_plen_82_part_00